MGRSLNFTRYDCAAWLTFIAYASASLAIPVLLVEIAQDLGFPLSEGGGKTAGGALQLARSFSMCLSMAFAGWLGKRFGIKSVVMCSIMAMAAGMLAIAFSQSWLMIVPPLLMAGLGEGVVEGLSTPFVQEEHEKEPARYVNFAHGFWSLGTFAFVIAAGIMLSSGVSWRCVFGLVFLLCLPPVALLALKPKKRPLPVKKPDGQTAEEPLAAKTLDIVKTPAFWIFFASMIFAGGGEYCLTFWCASFVKLAFGGSHFASTGAVALFALGMFAGRTIFGATVPQRMLKRLIVATGIAGALVSLMIPLLSSYRDMMAPSAALGLLLFLLLLSGFASAPFWPSIQSLTVDLHPRLDSTMIFILLSCAGVPGAGIFTWLIGVLGDKAGLTLSFLTVPTCYIIMTLLVLLGAKAAKRSK